MDFITIASGSKFNTLLSFINHLDYERINFRLPNVINIIPTISTFDTIGQFVESLEEAEFDIENEYGKLLLISKKSQNEKISYYAFFNEKNNSPIFLTDAKKTEDIPNTLFNYINKTHGISNLWIPPKIMKQIKDDLALEYPEMLITKFSGVRSINSEIHSKLRPYCERNLQYHGNDGKETLKEMEIWYGVLPKILEIRLPTGVAFKIDDKGIFSHRSGRFEDSFKIINNVVDLMIDLRDYITKSDYEIRHFGKTNQFSRAIQKPWSIRMSYGLDADDIPKFCDLVQGSDWNFTILKDVLLTGSILYNARMIDDNSGALFDITTTGKKIDVFPVIQRDLSSSMRFYQFVLSHIDNTAQVG
jgi:hypothetical protein